MGKYRKKPVVIEAEVYHAGLEDGFSCIPFVARCVWADEHGHYKLCFKCPLNIKKKPFIKIMDDDIEYNEYINEGDWVITDVEGKKDICNPNEFEETYEAVDER